MTRIPLIIDCDPGLDDAVSILLALASPEIDLLGICTVAGNVALEFTQTNARKICELAGRPDIAVYAGCDRPLLRPQIFGKYSESGGLGGDLLPAPTMPLAKGHAVDFLVDQARLAAANGKKLTLCAQAPQTNLALAIVKDTPAMLAGVERIVMMAGAFSALGNRAPWAEFNVFADPHAARIVFESGIPITVLPLDVTFQALLTNRHLSALQAVSGRVGETLARLLQIYDRTDVARFGREGGPLHDPMVVACLLRPDLFESREAYVNVETESPRTLGHTFIDFYKKLPTPPNATVMTRVDEEGFFSFLTERLSIYGKTQTSLN